MRKEVSANKKLLAISREVKLFCNTFPVP